VARSGFGNPKKKKKADVYVCPECGSDLGIIKRGTAMYLTCTKAPALLKNNPDSAFDTSDYPKGHTNFAATCDIGDVLVVDGRKNFEVKGQ